MKNLVIITVFIISLPFIGLSQTPKEGSYQSADGAYNFSLTLLDNGNLEIVEPNKTSIYQKSGNAFQHAEAKYSQYMIRIASPTVLYSFKKGNTGETQYSWIGTDIFSEEECALAEKYQEMAEDEDDPEVQAYTFCAVAALAKCNYTPEGFATYAAGTVMVMKQIIVNKSKCPCTDVIPQAIWDAN